MSARTVPEPYLALDDEVLDTRIRAAKEALGSSTVILGHHYQRDDVIAHADVTGDSFKLARLGAARTDASFIVFCGVHFMAESADILRGPGQTVILPDLNAGCSMADMAATEDVLIAGETLDRLGIKTVPVTYMNSTAALGIPLESMVVWDPAKESGGLTREELTRARVILWKGCCSVHTKFQLRHVEERRREDPDVRILVHPEVPYDVVRAADEVGSTEHIIRVLEKAPAGSRWAVGTEYHLVNRLARRYADKKISILSKDFCVCATMYRISPQNLLWALENLIEGNVVNAIRVPESVKRGARVALDRMLQVG